MCDGCQALHSYWHAQRCTAKSSVAVHVTPLPFTVQGDYPSLMRERCGDRLPRFTAEQRNMLVGSVDFFGLNHYSSHLCEQPAWYKELAPQEDEVERENKLVRGRCDTCAALGFKVWGSHMPPIALASPPNTRFTCYNWWLME